jgi:hypothetical protein
MAKNAMRRAKKADSLRKAQKGASTGKHGKK